LKADEIILPTLQDFLSSPAMIREMIEIQVNELVRKKLNQYFLLDIIYKYVYYLKYD